MAPRETKNSSVRMTRSGHLRLGQVQSTAPSGWISFVSQKGQVFRRVNLCLAAITRGNNGTDDVGDDIARSLDDDAVAASNIKRRHLIIIVQAGIGNSDAADGVKTGSRFAVGVTLPVRPILIVTSSNLVVVFLGGKLVSDGAARIFADHAQLATEREIIHLQYQTIDLKGANRRGAIPMRAARRIPHRTRRNRPHRE